MTQVKINGEEILSQQKTVLKKVEFSIQQKNGEWQTQEREVFDHGNAVTALLYNKEKGTVLLTKQFRVVTYLNGNASGLLLETCAGLLEEGETPEETMIREIKEETGFEVKKVEKLFEAYSSPGAYKELVHYFIAAVSDEQKTSAGGGLAEEGEDVKLVELPFTQAVQMLAKGEIKDAKTILLLLYAQVNNLL
ncbi:MAG TPA: NUDIX domain-containing protein [Flavisolibacter sp.]|jgi:nudix-type nucleoside diphosphatase (YffH/AdpP family)|nr:NUDIX domain-containing protein [Flavisolibacter sp.]